MPKQVDHDARRRHLLQTWFALIASEGYRAVTMRSLARAAGVSTGAVYHYFSDKAAILDAAFEAMVTEDLDRLARGEVAPPDAAHPVAGILAYVDLHRDRLRNLLLVAIEVLRHEPSDQSLHAVAQAVQTYREGLGRALNTTDPTIMDFAFRYSLGLLIHEVLDTTAIATEDATTVVRLFEALRTASHA